MAQQGTSQLATRSTRHTLKSCDELTVLFNLALVAFKSFVVVGDFDIAHAAITYVVHVYAMFRFFQVSTLVNNCCH